MASDPSGADKRAHPREEAMRRGVVIHQPSGNSVTCVIVDVSLGGARLQLYAPALPDEGLTLIDAKMGTIHQLRVAWRNGPFVGVAFTSTSQLPAH